MLLLRSRVVGYVSVSVRVRARARARARASVMVSFTVKDRVSVGDRW